MTKLYRVQEFAKLAGVTVRALHHYDRLGLLKPSRTEAGYRLYYLRDLERLEQIVALKFLGISLKQIRMRFHRGTNGISDSLRMQRRVLEEKRRLLDSAIRAIEEAEQDTAPGNRPDSAILKKIIEVIQMQDNMDWSKKYYSEEAQAKIEERKKLWSPENQERWTKEWTDLFRDLEAALGEDPVGAKAQALAARWKKLVEGFTSGDQLDYRWSQQNVSGPPQLADEHATAHAAVQQQESLGVHSESLRRRKNQELAFALRDRRIGL